MAIITRKQKGSPLTWEEIDENFKTLQDVQDNSYFNSLQEVIDLEEKPNFGTFFVNDQNDSSKGVYRWADNDQGFEQTLSKSDLTGPQGPQGETGPQGPTGPEGPEGSNNRIDEDIFNSVGYTRISNGNINEDPNWSSTDLIEIGFLEISEILLYGHPSVAVIAFFDDNKHYISGVTAEAQGEPINSIGVIPENAKYYSFTKNKQGLLEQIFKYNINIKYIQNIKQTIIEGQDEINFDIAKIATDTGYIDLNGRDAGNSDNNWRRSGFIECEPGVGIICKLLGHPAVSSLYFYDKDKTPLSGITANTNYQEITGVKNSVAGTAYIRISFPNTEIFPLTNIGYVNKAIFETPINIFTEIIEINNKVEHREPYISRKKLNLQPSDKIILYGTSISSTDYPWYKEAFENLTGSTVYNGGFSGQTAAQNASNTSFQRIIDYGAKLVIAMTGGNDRGNIGTVGTFSGYIKGEPIVNETDISADYNGTYFIQAVDHIMRKFKNEYYNIRERANLTGDETEVEKQAKIDAVLKPILVFCTPLPQKRIDSNNDFSKEENWLRKRAAVIECSIKNKIHCVDLFNKIPIDMELEPYWVAPTDKNTNNGIYYMDGLHPNKTLFEIMASVITAELGI